MPLLVLITVLGAALRFVALGHQGLWLDESYSAYLVHLSLGRMWTEIPRTESTPPLYYTVAWVWVRIFGFGAAGLRSLSALAGTLTLPSLWLAARRFGAAQRTALILAALAATNPLLIWYSQEARAYALLILAACWVLISFAAARANPGRRTLLLWGLASAIALCTHYYTVLVVVPTAAWLIYEQRGSRELRNALALVAVVGLALLPLLLVQGSTGNQAWIAGIPLSFRLGQIPALALIGPVQTHHDLFKWIAFAAAATGFALLALRALDARAARGLATGGAGAVGHGPSSSGAGAVRLPQGVARVAALLTLAGFVLSAVGWFLDDSFLARNLLGLWPAAGLTLACGLAVSRTHWLGGGARWIGAGATAVLVALGLVTVIGVDRDYGLQRPNWEPVARVIGPAPANGSARLILVLHNPAAYPLDVYLGDVRYVKGETVRNVTEFDIVVAHVVAHGRLCWWGSSCNLVPAHLQAHYALAGFVQDGPVVNVEQFAILRLRAETPQTVAVGEVRAALHHPHFARDSFLVQRR